MAPGSSSAARAAVSWDVDGNEFIEYGMGLRAVTLGHAYPRRSIEAVTRAAARWARTSRGPAAIEIELRRGIARHSFDGAEMVKFAKDGSDATTAAVKLARAYTGRDDGGDLRRPSVLLVRRLVHRCDPDGRRHSRRGPRR